MHIVVLIMNNNNFVATHQKAVVQYTMECETTTSIYSVPNLVVGVGVQKFLIVIVDDAHHVWHTAVA